MSEKLVPPRPQFQGEAPTQERLVSRFDGVHDQHVDRLEQVNRMAKEHESIGKGLKSDLMALHDKGKEVEDLQAPTSTGMLDGLIRRFTRNRQTLMRRSATEDLVQRYEAVSTKLRRASAFTDDLRLAVLELQTEVQQLNRDRDQAKANAMKSAARILEMEKALERAIEEANGSGALIDELQFELRLEGQNLKLFRAWEELCDEHIPPARGLRDTVHQLHEEMQAFVLEATGTMNAAGRRIQALGAAADAPVVVGELQQSLDELQQAMTATENYLTQTRELIAHKLPDLSAKINAERTVQAISMQADFDAFDRERSRREAEQALREAAMREIESLGVKR